jgi:hypothetical protein
MTQVHQPPAYLHRREGSVRFVQQQRLAACTESDLAWDLKRQAIIDSGLLEERRLDRISTPENRALAAEAAADELARWPTTNDYGTVVSRDPGLRS